MAFVRGQWEIKVRWRGASHVKGVAQGHRASGRHRADSPAQAAVRVTDDTVPEGLCAGSRAGLPAARCSAGREEVQAAGSAGDTSASTRPHN